MYSNENFQETKLPRKSEFYSMLYESYISEDDCGHAQKVWKTLSLKNLRRIS